MQNCNLHASSPNPQEMEVEYTDGLERMEIPTMMKADESQHEKNQTWANVTV